MKRGYTHERYREIIHSIRRHMPDASVSGDAIVGFPGETEEQFLATVQLVEEVGFDRVNTGGFGRVRSTRVGWSGSAQAGLTGGELERREESAPGSGLVGFVAGRQTWQQAHGWPAEPSTCCPEPLF